ncbi:MAG: endonuclease III [Candidatus Bathyarchaeota archaeon]|nr:endonuclease III [Candidatus Bathyarchaeota archaeon]
MKVLDPKYIPVLEEKYGRYWWPVEYPQEVSKDPFKNLIITVLSQNTSEINCVRAYKGLTAKFQVKPEVLAGAKVEDLREAIRSGGLYNVKSKRIKEVSKAVLEKFGGDLSAVLALPKEEAREKLMELPGIGKKTADVLLAQRHSYAEVMVVDTHMERIAKRLGLVKPEAKYEDIQKALKHFIPWEKGERTGGLFWLLAKYTCRAQNPKCHECPIIELCDHGSKTKKK